MLKVFRKNQFFRSLLLLPLALVLNIQILIGFTPNAPLYNSWLDAWLSSNVHNFPVLHWLLFGIVLFMSSILLNRLVIINRLSNSISLFPGLFYLVFLSLFPSFGQLNSITILSLVLILMTSNILYANVRVGSSSKIFNSGIYAGIMFLLFSPSLFFMFFLVITINILRTIKPKDLLNLLNGFLVPIYFYIIFRVFTYGLHDINLDSLIEQIGFRGFRWPMDLENWLIFGLLGLLALSSLLSFNSALAKKGIQTIRKITSIAWIIPVAILAYLFSTDSGMSPFVLMLIPFAFLFSEQMIKIKKESTAELIFIILLVSCLFIPWLVA